jgi:hypothetical protein
MLFNIGADNPKGMASRAKLSNCFISKLSKEKKRDPKKYGELIIKSEEVYQLSWKDFPDGISIGIPQVIYFLVVQNPELFKPYKVNKKHLEKLTRSSDVKDLAMDSSKVARSTIKSLMFI